MAGPHHARKRGRALLSFTVALCLSAASFGADAAPAPATDQARARDAFERGSAAYRVGDFARAASEYARADALDPNASALRAAIDAATLADDPVLGTELLERTARAPADPESKKAIDAARARFAHRTGRVVIRCAVTGACLATIDGVAVDASRPKIVSVGPHSVVVQSDGGLQPRIVSVAADQTVEVATPQPAPSPATPASTPAPATGAPNAEPGAGVPRVYFFVSLGATAITAGLGVGSAIDTFHQHSQFVSQGCARAALSGCGTLATDGKSAETRTNVLFAVSGALALTSAMLGVLVHWHRESFAIVANGAGASLHIGF
jgi:hypothetical protein